MKTRTTPILDVLALLFALSTVTPELMAQRVWIVDAQRQPGYDFADLPPAMTAASPGDVIRVRSASTLYTTATLQKGLTIIGGRYDLSASSWLIRNIPAGQTLTLVDIVSGANDQTLRLELRNIQGRVVLDRCRSLDSSPWLPVARSGLVVDQCAEVFLRGCSTFGSPPLAVSRSNVVAVDCRWNGVDPTATVGVYVADSVLTLAQNTVQSVERPAVDSLRSSLTATGDGPVYFQSGGSLSIPAAIQTSGGTVHVDPALPLNPFQNGPAVGGNAVVTVRNVSFALGSSVQRGGQMLFELAGAPGLQGTLLLALPSTPLPTPFGNLHLDLSAMVPLISAVIPGNRRITFRAPVPATVGHGVILHLQGVVLEAGNLVLSEPCAVVTS